MAMRRRRRFRTSPNRLTRWVGEVEDGTTGFVQSSGTNLVPLLSGGSMSIVSPTDYRQNETGIIEKSGPTLLRIVGCISIHVSRPNAGANTNRFNTMLLRFGIQTADTDGTLTQWFSAADLVDTDLLWTHQMAWAFETMQVTAGGAVAATTRPGGQLVNDNMQNMYHQIPFDIKVKRKLADTFISLVGSGQMVFALVDPEQWQVNVFIWTRALLGGKF